jgi:signal transduction histidine kinase
MDLSVSEVRLADRRLFTGFVRDITQRKRSEERMTDLAHNLAEKNKELETVVYVASHDLRSPLVNIQGFSKELIRSCRRVQELMALVSPPGEIGREFDLLMKEEIPESIAYIQAGVAKIDMLLSGFLRFSRLGRESLQIERLDMDAILASVIQAMEFQIQRCGAEVELGELPACRGDAAQINQVFTNLLDNALKYMPSDRCAHIRIQGAVENGRVIYNVADNGIGISTSHQEKIFQIFHRLDPEAGEGEGLGLTIAQRILERQNGRIWVESEPGRGSTFFVSLPKANP